MAGGEDQAEDQAFEAELDDAGVDVDEPSPQAEEPQPASDAPSTPAHVIVAGYGPVGRFVAERLLHAGLKVTIVERNTGTIKTQLHLGMSVCYGEITQPATLVKAGLASAEALVLTVPNSFKVIEACRIARRLSPNLYIAVRTDHLSDGNLAREAGADEIIVEEVVTARAMGDAILTRLMEDNGSSTASP